MKKKLIPAQKLSIEQIRGHKHARPLVMLTCYDFSCAAILDSMVDMLLVGDSMANVILGMKHTCDISCAEMIAHTQAVAQGAPHTLIVADMPYKAYQKNPRQAVAHAKKFLAAGADAVKLEWFASCAAVVKDLTGAGVPVMGHIGLTPQTAHQTGGFTVRGKDSATAQRICDQAKTLEQLGAFSVVLECVPLELARHITQAIQIPTIGIGAGKYCDGQVLVLHDVIGLYPRFKPKFVRQYARTSTYIKNAITHFTQDVRQRKYPLKKESFTCKPLSRLIQ